MTVTPVVSPDRRYVRLTVNAYFNAINGFTNFTTPLGAVGGGGGGGGRRPGGWCRRWPWGGGRRRCIGGGLGGWNFDAGDEWRDRTPGRRRDTWLARSGHFDPVAR